MFARKFQSPASIFHCPVMEIHGLFCFCSVNFFLVNINPESSTVIFYLRIQIKPFTEAKEQSTKLILTDLCGMYLWD